MTTNPSLFKRVRHLIDELLQSWPLNCPQLRETRRKFDVGVSNICREKDNTISGNKLT